MVQDSIKEKLLEESMNDYIADFNFEEAIEVN